MHKLSKEKMPTAITANNYPIHKWFNFVAGYAPEYVEYVINTFKNKNGSLPRRIYDPFSGCATTNVVANAFKIPSIGVERNPFFYRIGYAKVNANRILHEVSTIEKDLQQVIDLKKDNDNISLLSDAAKIFLLKLFDMDSLEILLRFRNQIKKYSSFSEIRFLAGFIFISKILEFTTHAKTDGIYRVPSSTKKKLDISEAINKTKMLIFEGYTESLYIENKCKFVYDSSIDYCIESDTLDLVIFSPPYLNNFDFAEMTRMQLYFWEDATSWADISSKHRNHMLVNTTTALKLVKDKKIQENMRDTLPNDLLEIVDVLVSELEKIRKIKPSKKEYHLLIYPYLAQMKKVLLNCYHGLAENGEIHIVVSDAAFYGIHVDTQQFLKMLLLDIGYKHVQIIQMRTRGDRWILEKRKSSGRQLGEYEIIGYKE